MTNALAVINSSDEFEIIQRTGRMLAASGFFGVNGESPQAIAQMATKVLAGRELGFGPFASVNGIHIINGKPAVGANLMAAAVKGHPTYDYRVRKLDNSECVIEFFQYNPAAHKLESIGVSSFSMQDAQAAGVLNNPTWKKYPKNMLFARAMSNGVRWYCPDVFSGNAVYVPEELGAEVDGDGNVVEGTWQEAPPEPEPDHPFEDDDPDVDFGMGAKGEPEPEPWYAEARALLQNGVAKFADAALGYHRDGGPASERQYQYLVGLLNSIIKDATGADDGHKRVLSVLCQADISSNNPPSKTLATRLLDKLATHKKQGDEKVENPAYDQSVVDACVAIYRAAEAVATPTLFAVA